MAAGKKFLGIDFSEQLHGSVFDWSVMLMSISLSFIFPSMKDFISSPYAELILLVALILYITGAWLKRIPLASRLTLNGKTDPFKWSWLLFILFVIMMIVGIFASNEIGNLTGLYKPDSKNGNAVVLFLGIFLAMIATGLTAWAGLTRNIKKSYAAQWLLRRERFADILLIIAVSIFTFVFWVQGPEAFIRLVPIKNAEMAFGEIVFLVICYPVLYLPFRYLYIVEDGHLRSTWKRLWMLVLIVLIKFLIDIS